MHWTSPYRDPPPPDMFNLDLTVQGPPTIPVYRYTPAPALLDSFKLVHYEACTVAKQVVGIIMECCRVLGVSVCVCVFCEQLLSNHVLTNCNFSSRKSFLVAVNFNLFGKVRSCCFAFVLPTIIVLIARNSNH